MGTFGEWCKHQRNDRGYTLKSLEARSGVSYGAISDWERGRRLPTRDNAVRIAEALGADPREALEALMADTPGLEPLPEIKRTPDPDREMWVGAYDNVPEHRRKILLELAEQLRQDEKDTTIG